MKAIEPKEAVEVLNRLLQKDFWAIQNLFQVRVDCNIDLAKDETCQVKQEPDGRYSVGLIGIINSIFGAHDDGQGFIAYSVGPDKKGFIQQFLIFK